MYISNSPCLNSFRISWWRRTDFQPQFIFKNASYLYLLSIINFVTSVKLIVSTASHEQDYQKCITNLLSYHRILIGDNRRTTRSLQYRFDKQDMVKKLSQIACTFVFWFSCLPCFMFTMFHVYQIIVTSFCCVIFFQILVHFSKIA